MEIENIKTNNGKIKFFKTREASFNIETILPKRKLPTFYLKRNTGYLIVLEGMIDSPKKRLKKGDWTKIKPKQRFWLENKTNKKAKFLAIDVPPIKEGDIVWI